MAKNRLSIFPLDLDKMLQEPIICILEMKELKRHLFNEYVYLDLSIPFLHDVKASKHGSHDNAFESFQLQIISMSCCITDSSQA